MARSLNHYLFIRGDKDAFVDRLMEVSSNLQVEPNHLMDVMYLESKLDPQAVNRYSGATGLIQFMPNTARTLGTTTEALARMDSIQQLDFVEKYLRPYRGRMNSLVDTYFAVFFPAAIGQPKNAVLMTSKLSPALIAKQNPGYDLNKDRQITVGEVEQAINRALSKKKTLMQRLRSVLS